MGGSLSFVDLRIAINHPSCLFLLTIPVFSSHLSALDQRALTIRCLLCGSLVGGTVTVSNLTKTRDIPFMWKTSAPDYQCTGDNLFVCSDFVTIS